MSTDKNNISSNNDNSKDFMTRINRLLDKDKELPSDDELAQRFNKLFDSEPIVNEKQKPNYSIPSSAHDEEVDQYLLEAQLLQSDNSDDNNDDDYLTDILNSHTSKVTTGKPKTQGQQQQQQQHHEKALKTWQDTFLGPGDVILDDEGHELIQQLKDQAAVENKYASFEQQRDDELERRYLALKKDSDDIIGNNTVSSSTASPTRQSTSQHQNQASKSTSFLRGSVPKPLEVADLHDEMDDWCCVCNEDAVIQCEDCDNDRFCRQCFYDGHQSDMANYGFSKHRSKKYTK